MIDAYSLVRYYYFINNATANGNIMNNLIGTILEGSIAGEDATFEVVNVCKDGADVFVIAECVEFGAPFQKIAVADINKPVRA